MEKSWHGVQLSAQKMSAAATIIVSLIKLKSN